MSSTAALPGLIDSRWRVPLALLGLLLAGLLLLYGDTAAGMVEIWARSETFAHGFLVLPISLWLIWRGRDRLIALQPHPSPVWLLPLLLAAVAWLVGEMVAVNALAQFALVAMLVLSVPLVLGWPATRVMLFPLLFLFFGVPIGEFLLPLLMEHTADFTVRALRLSGVPVYREGLNFMIPSGNWSVVEACSGVRYLIASLMVGSLFAYLNYQSLARRLAFVGVSIVVPIVANWLRAYMIVMLGHLSNNKIATGVDHLVYGWVFFGVVITIMFLIGMRWSEPPRVRERDSGATAQGVPAKVSAWVLAIGGAIAVVALSTLALNRLQAGTSAQTVALPAQWQATAAWHRVDTAPEWEPHFEGAAATLSQGFEASEGKVGVYVAYYRRQGPGRKLVSSVNTIIGSRDREWAILSDTVIDVGTGGDALTWKATHLISRLGAGGSLQRHRTAWQTYWVDDHLTASDSWAKLYGVRGLFAGRGDDAAAIVLYTDRAPEEGGNSLLTHFAEQNLPALLHALRQTRPAR